MAKHIKSLSHTNTQTVSNKKSVRREAEEKRRAARKSDTSVSRRPALLASKQQASQEERERTFEKKAAPLPNHIFSELSPNQKRRLKRRPAKLQALITSSIDKNTVQEN